MKYLIYAAMLALCVSCAPNDGHSYVKIKTEFGNMTVMLYNGTPKHRDNFVKLAKEGFYDDLLFHRVIEGFMIQGGDPNSRDADQNRRLGGGGPGYEIDAEIGALHLYGALAAARNNNPEKRSNGSQFYIVHGKKINPAQLNNGNYTDEQKELYTTLGGTPQLDNSYTVFGEVVEGLEVIDKIAAVQTNQDRPLEDVVMSVKVMTPWPF